MIITSVEPIPLRIPFRAGNRSGASAWGDSNLPAADSLVVKVTTDQGLIGWAEAIRFRAAASAKLAIDQLIAPPCVGQHATRIEPLMLDIQKMLHVFGRAGALAFAMSAVDIALWISQARPLSPKRGRISVPQGPGLGIDPNPDVIKAYRWNQSDDESLRNRRTQL